jgi:2-methylisocitrate lyase-like PEP mutase family enzyme
MRKKTSRRQFFQVAGSAAGLMAVAHPSPGAAAPQAPPPASRTSMGNRFRALLQRPDFVVCMGAHDVLTARLVEMAGIPSIFIGGSTGASNGHALPDIGLVSTTELIEYAARIMANIDTPCLVDADDAGGTPLDVYRNAKAFERAGAGAVMYEDRIRTDRLKGVTRVSPVNEMVDRIHAAKDACPEMLFVLRSEAVSAKLPMEETLARGVEFAKAGVDILFFAGMKIEDFPRAADAVKIPLYGSFYVPPAQIKAARIKLAVYTSNLRDISSGAAYNALMEFKATGEMVNAEKNDLPANIMARVTRNQELSDLRRKYNQ